VESVSVLVPLAEGFEEIEAIAVVDILRRAELTVTTASLGERRVRGSHGVVVEADATLEECIEREWDALVLPGGPGTKRLVENGPLADLARRLHREGRWLAAICAAPTALARWGLLEGRRATVHPAHVDELEGARFVEDPVVVDDRIVTSRGAGTAVAFALELVARMVGEERARRIGERIVHPGGR
jgi:4-methyl-5(b-hydroxyethyl)-thiazole monophosphate biosynthesis